MQNAIAIGPAKPLSETDIEGDAIRPGDPLFGIVWINPHRMSGVPCFAGTRVPIISLFQHIEAGDSLDTFLDDFLGVTREQAIAVLELSQEKLFAELGSR